MGIIKQLSYKISSNVWKKRRRQMKTFEEIREKTGYSENDVIKLMRNSLKPSSFKLWRKRTKSQSIKHRKKFEISRKLIKKKINKFDY